MARAVSTLAARRRVRPLGGRGRPALRRIAPPGGLIGTAAPRLRAALARHDDDASHAVVLEAVARSLRGGTSIACALHEAADMLPPGPVAADLRAALTRHERGAPIVAVVDAWVAADPSSSRALAGAALAIGSEFGGARARALDGAAAGLRDRADLAREVRALTSQARSSTLVMVVAPVVFAVYAWTTDHRIAVLMLTTPLGWSCLASGILLDGIGAWWMAKLAARIA
jgi:tight adherence protein B